MFLYRQEKEVNFEEIDLRLLGQIMKVVFERSGAEDSPSFEEICKAGKLMGLDLQDIIRLSQVTKATRIRSFLSKHPFIFVLVAAFAYLVLLLAVSASPPETGSLNTYPAGARYGVIGIRDFQRRGYMSRRRNDSRWMLVRVK
jgi:hypothetical protein